MKLLFVHQFLGALGGAEANIHLTARELKRRGHEIGLLHGTGTGAREDLLIDGYNGFLVPWMDTRRFALRVEQLLLDKDLARKLGRQGLERVNRCYEASHQIDGMENMFHQVLSETRQSGGIPIYD